MKTSAGNRAWLIQIIKSTGGGCCIQKIKRHPDAGSLENGRGLGVYRMFHDKQGNVQDA
jgi:hypothetical protein